MTRRTGAAALALIGASVGFLVGCGGTIDTSQRVAKLELRTDQLGALQATACLKLNGEDACARYPNPNACDRMDVSVMGDGSTVAECLNGGVVVNTIVGSVAGGVPIICKLADEKGCVTCADMYGVIVTDTCNKNTRLFADTTVEEQPAQPGGAPAAAPTDKCDPQNARLLYAAELNKVLQAEGLSFSYAPDLSRKTVDKSGMFKTNGKVSDICTYWEQQASKDNKYTECNVNQPGRCNCEVSGTKTTCKCGRINIRALRAACQAIPPDCQRGAWTESLTIEYAAANVFLFKGSYKKPTSQPAPTQPTSGDRSKASGASNVYSAIPTPVESTVPSNLQCQGSPLVLDLLGDGVNLLPVDEGPSFDLMGFGAQKTAWVKGDDALLVLDRNGNGRVDSGRELFGEASEVSGPTEDGFQALAVLDRPEQGGNANGRIDSGDRAYAQLRLWNDKNGDGVSQKGELRGLKQAGVQTLELKARSTGKVDRFGNDLRLESSFVGKAGRRGLLVDVFFVVK